MRSPLPSFVSYSIGLLCISCSAIAALGGFWFVRTNFNNRMIDAITHELASTQPSVKNISRSLDIYKKVKSTLFFLHYDTPFTEDVTTSEALLYAMTALSSQQPESAIRTLLNTSKTTPKLRKILADFQLSQEKLIEALNTFNSITLRLEQIATDRTNLVQPEVWLSEYKLIRDGLAAILGIQSEDLPVPTKLTEDSFYNEGVLFSFPILPGLKIKINSLEELTAELKTLNIKTSTPLNEIPDKVNELRTQSIPLYRGNANLFSKLKDLEKNEEQDINERAKMNKQLFAELTKVVKNVLDSQTPI